MQFVVAMENITDPWMVRHVSQLLIKNKHTTKTFNLQIIYGIFVITCVICHENYVGQTSNKFSVR